MQIALNLPSSFNFSVPSCREARPSPLDGSPKAPLRARAAAVAPLTTALRTPKVFSWPLRLQASSCAIWTYLDQWRSVPGLGAWESYERDRAAQEIIEHGERLSNGGVRCKNGLELIGYDDLEDLPEGLYVEGPLDLGSFSKLKRLPAWLNVSGNLRLCNCPALREIPASIQVGGIIEISGCNPSLIVPQGMRVRIDGLMPA